jgi:hypothetical protein
VRTDKDTVQDDQTQTPPGARQQNDGHTEPPRTPRDVRRESRQPAAADAERADSPASPLTAVKTPRSKVETATYEPLPPRQPRESFEHRWEQVLTLFLMHEARNRRDRGPASKAEAEGWGKGSTR